MNESTYLIFAIRGTTYGIEATCVREIVWLPELSGAAEAPSYIVGLVNLRGQIVPAIDLDLRVGRQLQPYNLNHRLLMVAAGETTLALVVDEVRTVRSISADAVTSPLDYDAPLAVPPRLLVGLARAGSQTISLIAPESLLGEEYIPAESSQDTQATPTWSFYRHLCPDATPEQRQIFSTRAGRLAQSLQEESEAGEGDGVAVVELSGELFGFPVECIREFATVGRIFPLPCTPPYILGNFNLRGEIITLLDLRPHLQLSSVGQTSNTAVVVEVEAAIAAVGVARVLDVSYLPSEVANGEGKRSAHYGDRPLTLLDLPALMRSCCQDGR